jgi:acyl-CoA synthetase (AMP-forming)/AMP-acid ligase II
LGDQKDLNQARVAFMISPGFDYVAAQWGIWPAGGIAVPLCISYPPPSLNCVLKRYSSRNTHYRAWIFGYFRTYQSGIRDIVLFD